MCYSENCNKFALLKCGCIELKELPYTLASAVACACFTRLGCEQYRDGVMLVVSSSYLLFTVVEHTLGCCDTSELSSYLLLTRMHSSVPWWTGLSGVHEGWFSKDPLPVFPAGGHFEWFWHGQGCPLFDIVHPTFPLPSTASSTLQGALKDGFGEVVVACDVPNPASFCFMTIARRGSCGPSRNWILPGTQLLVLCSK